LVIRNKFVRQGCQSGRPPASLATRDHDRLSDNYCSTSASERAAPEREEGEEERLTSPAPVAAALEIWSAPAATTGLTACHRLPRPAPLPRPPRRPALVEAPPPPVCRRPRLPSKNRLVPRSSPAPATAPPPPPPKFYCSPASRSRLAVAFSAAASRGVVDSGEVHLGMDGGAQVLSLCGGIGDWGGVNGRRRDVNRGRKEDCVGKKMGPNRIRERVLTRASGGAPG
jgi:hypothetical protein